MLDGTYSPGYQHIFSVLKCTVPRGSYHYQISCLNMLEQLTGANWQFLPISTRLARPPPPCGELRKIIRSSSAVANFSLLKLVEHSQRFGNIKPTRNPGYKGGNMCASLWYGSICVCKTSFTIKNIFFFVISDISGISCSVPLLSGLSGVHRCCWHARRTT